MSNAKRRNNKKGHQGKRGKSPKTNQERVNQTNPIQPSQKERRTFYLDGDVIAKLQAIAYWDRVTMGDIVEDAIVREIRRLERKRGKPYEPIPKGRKIRQGRPPKW